MIIRQLTPQDMPEFARLRSIAFLRAPDHDPVAEDIRVGLPLAELSWGSFADDGPMMACLTNNSYQIHFDGHVVKMGGVGGVASLPEYRHGGAIRAIFAAMLRQNRDAGELFSTLYPFSHAYYRKFGYELCYTAGIHVFPSAVLSGFRHNGWSRLLQSGESTAVLVPIYEQFSARYNLSASGRDARAMSRLLKGDPYLNQSFTYILGDTAEPFAYVHFSATIMDGRMTISVADYAFTTPAGWRGLLGFLHRFAANCKAVRICLPEDIPIAALVDNPDEENLTGKNRLMARAVQVAAVLSLLRRPSGAAFTIGIDDAFLPENSGIYRVTDTGAIRTDAAADLEVDIGTFTQLCLGYLDLQAALFKPAVRLNGNQDALAQVFVRKPLYLADHF